MGTSATALLFVAAILGAVVGVAYVVSLIARPSRAPRAPEFPRESLLRPSQGVRVDQHGELREAPPQAPPRGSRFRINQYGEIEELP